MKIIETTTVGKQGPAKCEDGVVVSADYLAVIDGSTSKWPHPLDKTMSNGRWAMLTISGLLCQAPPALSCESFCQWLSEQYGHALLEAGVDRNLFETHPECRPTASAAIYSAHCQEVWLIGDCQCLAGGIHYENPKPGEAANALRRAHIINDLLASGATTVSALRRHDIGRDQILSDIISTCQGQNRDFSVIDGTPIATQHVVVVDASGVSEMVLGTDGYPLLFPSLGESEQFLSELLAEDPLMIGRYKATKGVMEGFLSFDDRCYLRFSP